MIPTGIHSLAPSRDTESMPAKRWRPWLWGLVCAALAAALYAGYLFLRRTACAWIGQIDSAPSLVEQALVAGLLLVPAVLVFAYFLRQHYRRTLHDLARRIRSQCKNPTLHWMRSVP